MNVSPIPEHGVLLFLVQFSLILFTARFLGALVQKLGQPAVLGELTAGILLGPSVLGAIAPGAQAAIFPSTQLSFHLLEIVSWLGMIFLLFTTGLETNLKVLRQMGRRTMKIVVCDLSVALAVGVTVGHYLPAHFMGSLQNQNLMALFMGVAVSISAIPVLAKILIDLNLIKRNFGVTAVGAAMTEDLIGWVLLSVVMDLAHRGTFDLPSVLRSAAVTVVFLLIALSLGRRLVATLMTWVDERFRQSHMRLTFSVVVVLSCAAITQAIGIHAVFGAFVGGMIVGESTRFRPKDRELVEGASFGIFSPIFFSFAGLQVRLHEMQDWNWFLIVLAAAISAKLIGSYVGSRLGGLGKLESAAMGVGLNARGSMELVLALLGLSAGIISPPLFSIVVMTAVATTIMTPPLLRAIARHIPLHPDEEERLNEQVREDQAIFRKKDMKILIPTAGGPNAATILKFAAPIVKEGKGSLSLLMVREPGRSIRERILKLFGQDSETIDLQKTAETIKGVAQRESITIAPKLVTSESKSDAVLAEAGQGYDLLFLGFHSDEDPYGGEFLEKVVSESPGHVAIFRSKSTRPAEPFRKILVPTKGDSLFPFVFEFAALYADRVPGASLTIAHARTEGWQERARWNPIRRFAKQEAPPVSSPDSGDLVAEAIRSHSKPENQTFATEFKKLGSGNAARLILREANAGDYDLIIVGAVTHLLGGHLFFGHLVSELSHRAPCPLIVVTPRSRG